MPEGSPYIFLPNADASGLGEMGGISLEGLSKMGVFRECRSGCIWE